MRRREKNQASIVPETIYATLRGPLQHDMAQRYPAPAGPEDQKRVIHSKVLRSARVESAPWIKAVQQSGGEQQRSLSHAIINRPA